MYTLLKFYATIIRKYVNKPKNIKKMHKSLNDGYNEYLKRKDSDNVFCLGSDYLIVRFKTKIFLPGDDLINYICQLLKEQLNDGDIITVAESVIGVTQGRAYKLDEVKASKWAYLLYPWVSNVTYGTGLGMPETMECAIREVGIKKILKATIFGALDRLRKKHGSFYEIAGPDVKSIDFKKNHPISFKGSSNYIVLSPKRPVEFCKSLYSKTNHSVSVVDANNVSVDILALYPFNKEINEILKIAMRGNPAGQDDEKTPIVVIRKIKK